MCASPSDRRRRLRRAAAALVGLLALAGCFAAVKLVAIVPGFDHAAHAKRDLSCVDCHEGAEGAKAPGMPGISSCVECHDPRTEKPEINAVVDELRVALDTQRFPSPLVRTPSYADVRFDHGKHAAKMGSCVRCHSGVEQAGAPANPDGALTMDDCMACHDERGVKQDCASCHEKIGKDWAPLNHDAGWRLHHGLVSRAPDRGKPAERCDACHARADCDACHTQNAPRDHTNPFRVATHGLQASMDRSRCLACHTTDSCRRCHETQPPRSHRPGFGAPRATHCLSCHEPLGAQSCTTCHQGTPSHQLAAPKPPGHNALSNCRQCHGNGAALPHVDNLSDCNVCHH
jgi:hypothetical protein